METINLKRTMKMKSIGSVNWWWRYVSFLNRLFHLWLSASVSYRFHFGLLLNLFKINWDPTSFF